MNVRQLILLAFVVRLLMLGAQRIMGMDWDFHIDATYYKNNILMLDNEGLLNHLLSIGIENSFFSVLGWVLWIVTAKLLEPESILIIANILFSLYTIRIICKLCNASWKDPAPLSALFVGFSPYLVHLSIHPLKDTFFILLGALLIFLIIKRQFYYSLLFSIIIILTRFHLGIVTVFLLYSWGYFIVKISNKFWVNALAIFYLIGTYFVFEATLSERISVEFDGRDFFPSGLALVPESAVLRYFFGWFFNFLVPYPFFSFKVGEFFYFTHLLFFYIALLISAWRFKINKFYKSPFSYGLILVSLLLFSFVLTTTPGAGPLVRYRLFAELFLLLALSGKMAPFSTLNSHTWKTAAARDLPP